MPDGETWEWLEAYGRMECDIERLDYSDAQNACEKALDQMLPYEQLQQEFAERGKRIASAHGRIVRKGSGWGALANEIRSKEGLPAISSVCFFPAHSMGKLQWAWQKLLREGVMEVCEKMDFPVSYMIKPEWRELLAKAPQNALTAYYLGIIAHNEGNVGEAHLQFEKSLADQDNAPAHRALARMEALEKNENACFEHYRQALALAGDLLPLQLEYAQTLLSFEKYTELMKYLATLSEEIQNLPRFLYLRASADVSLGRYEEALAIMQSPLIIPDMREGELSLSELWFSLFMQRDGLIREEAEIRHPLPQVLDFRMH